MDDSMVERVARAICIASDNDCEGQLGWHDWLPEARAAIAAMREPTEAMAQIGQWIPMQSTGGAGIGIYASTTCWQTMIDAALADGTENPNA